MLCFIEDWQVFIILEALPTSVGRDFVCVQAFGCKFGLDSELETKANLQVTVRDLACTC